MESLDDAYANAAHIPNADRFVPHWEETAKARFEKRSFKRAARILTWPMARQSGRDLTTFCRAAHQKIF